jgi:hypothetical protein
VETVKKVTKIQVLWDIMHLNWQIVSLPAEMHNVPEDLILHQYCCENIKSHWKITVVNAHVIKTFKNHTRIELNG